MCRDMLPRMSTTKNRTIVLAITEGGLSINEAAQRFEVSSRWIRTLLKRFETDGLDGLEPRSRRPHTHPNATDPKTKKKILQLRQQLTKQGLDAGAESIRVRLPEKQRPAVSTIWRILKSEQLVTPQPQKRPRSSWHRFEAELPNGTWQSDFTHWSLENGDDAEIISWLDDHSRKLMHASAHQRITGAIVVDTFISTSDEHGLPASTLTDNGLVYTTRFARGANGERAQPNGFEQLLADLGIEQKNGAANHPTTQGKIEHYHQTLKLWLAAQPSAINLEQLNQQLAEFQHIYNTERPHRANKGKTPSEAYAAKEKAAPSIEIDKRIWRVRYDRIDETGKISLRHGGKLKHLGCGRAHAGRRVILLVHGNRTLVIQRGAGTIIAEHKINPERSYQPRLKER